MALTYWERRAVQRVLDGQKREDAAMRSVSKAIGRALQEIQDAIDRIGKRYAQAYDLTEDAAQEWLTQPADREEYTRLLSEIAQLPDGTEKTRLMARAASGGYAYRISQQEAMQAHVEAQAAILGVEIEKQTKQALETAGKETTESVRQDVQKMGLTVDTTGSSLSVVEEIMSTPWNGDDYSSRVWKNTEALKQLLDDTVMSGFLSGKSLRKIAAEVAEKMNVAYYQAERLVRTEVSRLQNAVALEELKRAGIAQYQWVAALDKRTCQVCGALDAKHFPVSKAKTGETLPPRHPFCRCTIVMYEQAKEGQTRFARDTNGQGTKVPAGTTYEQWAKQQGPQFATQQKMMQNRASDQAQYDEYRSVLGKNRFTADFAIFQQSKYTNAEAYSLLKLDYKRRNALLADSSTALPNAATVTAADEKFTRYLFNPENIDGWAKGVAFDSRLGYNGNNWKELQTVILSSALKYPATYKGDNQQGSRYEQRMVLYGLKDTPANVLVGWLAEKDSTHMTTMYIKEVSTNDKGN